MKRRTFLAGLALPLALRSIAARGQEAGRVYRLGMLAPTPAPTPPADQGTATRLIPQALGRLGYVEGRNLVLDRRYAEGRLERLPAIARAIVDGRPDVIVTIGSAATRAAMDATSSIPIVLYGNLDPVAAGLVSTLARPGGNVTGVLIAPEGTLAAKKMELLKEAVPGARRVVFLAPPDPNVNPQIDEASRAAARIRVELVVVRVKDGDYDAAFADTAARKPDALFVAGHTSFVRDGRQVIERANRLLLPAIYEWREHVVDGGLMSYGSSLQWTTARVADVVARILAGARPGDIAIEQPTQFRLVVNAGTAKSIGLALPQSLLLRADEVLP
jgi:putative ABC transport system substrate-binding protein